MKSNEVAEYLKNNVNQETTNLFEFFLEKATQIADYVALITPKALLNTPEFSLTRDYLKQFRIDCIEDFGEQGFKGVLVETICLFINTTTGPGNTKIISTTNNIIMNQKQKYICDDKLPYWVIYRDTFFDEIYGKMEFGIFNVFRDRQITNGNTSLEKKEGMIRVLKSRNIDDTGENIIDVENYDAFIDVNVARELSVYRFFNDENVYLTPNMTYNPRIMRNLKGCVVNGSVAVLIPKNGTKLTKGEMIYISSDEYRRFYQIARNYQTRSLNVDNASVYWFGKKKGSI